MNLFVVLIPMLLLSAVFLELSVIRMHLADEEATPPASESESLGLAIAIEDARWIVRGRSLASRTVSREATVAGVDPLDELSGVLSDIVADHPDTRDVVIESRPRTRYDDIIAVMDVSRETGLVGISLASAGP
jgi:biopolymer transport protein ExbD